MSRLTDGFVGRANDARIAVVDGSGAHTYAEIVRGAQAVRAALCANDAMPTASRGERVAVYFEPSAEFLCAFFGTLLAGGCVVVLSPLHPTPETRYFCEDAGVRTILVSRSLRERAEELGPALIEVSGELL